MRALVGLVILLLPLLPVAEAGEAHDLIVTLHPGAKAPGLPAMAELAVLNGFVAYGVSPSDEARLRVDPNVASVERAEELVRTSDPNLMLTRVDPPITDSVGLPYDGHGVTVAVVDSGVDRAHPDFGGRVKANVRLVEGAFVESPGDTNGHGTHVAGIVAADGSSSQGKVRGVAPGASLVGIDISDKFTTASALLAYDWLYQNREEHDIRVVVNAWGRVGNDRKFDPNDAGIRAIDRLVDSGVVVLFSASNHGPDRSSLSLEAQNPRVITVGAVDSAGELLSYSSRGPVVAKNGDSWVKPDLVAPGDTILGLRSGLSPPDTISDADLHHRYFSGTSQAVPHVGGIVALMIQARPTITPNEIQNALRESAIDIGPSGPDDETGFGLVDGVDAMHRAQGQPNDRLNVLVAGGRERFEDSRHVAAAATPSGFFGVISAPKTAWSTTFPVKHGADLVTFDLVWNAPIAPITVTLEHDGNVKGSWSQTTTEAGRVIVRGRVEAPPVGVWTLRAQGAAPAALEVNSIVEVTLQANPDRAVELDSRYKLSDAPPPASIASTYLPARNIVLPAAGGLGVVALSILGVVMVQRSRRKRDWEPILEEWHP